MNKTPNQILSQTNKNHTVPASEARCSNGRGPTSAVSNVTVKPLKVLYWPHYSNPYQELFYGDDVPEFSSEAKTIYDAIKLQKANPSERVVFHLHWLNFLFKGKSAERRETEVNEFINACHKFQEAGGVFVWTVHNLVEHDKVDSQLEFKLRSEIVNLASALFVHGNAARNAVVNAHPEAQGKIHTIAHGNYVEYYPNKIRKVAARAIIGLFETSTVFLNLGWIRPYKGLGALQAAMKSPEITDSKAKLLVVGKMRDADRPYFDTLFADAQNIIVREGWIADKSIQTYLNASDFMVLPYMGTLTSGAAMLSFSFSLPIIAPKIGAFTEIVQDGKNGFLYDPNDENGLQNALGRAIATRPEVLSQMKQLSLETALVHRWEDARNVFIEVVGNRSPEAML